MREAGRDGSSSAGRRARWGMALVRGRSMLPLLRPGDRLLVAYRRPVRPGAVVVARFSDGTVAVKRATQRRTTRADDPGWWLLSDNPAEGVDSRHRGVVAETDVLAVAIARIWPRPRRLRPAVPD
ncbi:S24 family peptidase [Nocardioides sp.]|uniref:S24 family peptidase n=1 Tax=Nocardioides sp. TaxID=35761 RepID=UPI002ED7CB8E